MIVYRQMTADDIDAFARLRIRQLVEEGGTADCDLLPALLDYYGRHLHDGTFISWLALDGERIVPRAGSASSPACTRTTPTGGRASPGAC